MTSYKYTKENRIMHPDKYMYTSFQGRVFLDAYHQDRLKHLERVSGLNSNDYKYKAPFNFYEKIDDALREILNRHSNKKECSLSKDNCYNHEGLDIPSLSFFDINSEIISKNLLVSLLNQVLDEKDSKLIKCWIDRLVQRFEVTKKIYQVYPKNLSKGKGKSDDVYLYWIFSISLAVYYNNSLNIKYLNTLLKVIDLLCSLQNGELIKNVPLQSFSLVLSVELLFIEHLSKNIGCQT